MNNSTRVLVNTLAQYVRTIVSAVITLYTSRIILQHLGVSDYGINDLIAGVIALFSFVNATLSQTTQRYLSYYQGNGDSLKLKQIFNNSVITQLALAVILCLTLLLIKKPLFEYVLNIDDNRINAAVNIYYFMIGSLFISLMSTPYLASLIAHENIVFSSVIQILDSILKIPIAFSLAIIPTDKLSWFGFCNFLIILLNFALYFFYALRKYNECRFFSFSKFDFQLLKEMSSFLGWTLYGTACIVGRSRGIAIVINRFFSTAVNGAFGIANQVCNQLTFLSVALVTAMRPQIIKAEGAGNRTKMLRLTEICCKFSIMLLAVISIPAIFEMEDLMDLWLVEVPQYAVYFSQMWVFSQLIDQFTVGLTIANAAVGNVKYYNIFTNTTKLMALPCIFILLYKGYPIESVMIVYVLFEFLCSLIRIVFFKININLSILNYLKNVVLPLLLPSLLTIEICFIYSQYSIGLNSLVCFVISAVVLGGTSLRFGLSTDEKQILMKIIKHKKGNV